MRLKVNKYLWMTSLNPKAQLKYEYSAASEYDFKLINPVLGAGGSKPTSPILPSEPSYSSK
jgi:hypothetical protein